MVDRSTSKRVARPPSVLTPRLLVRASNTAVRSRTRATSGVATASCVAPMRQPYVAHGCNATPAHRAIGLTFQIGCLAYARPEVLIEGADRHARRSIN